MTTKRRLESALRAGLAKEDDALKRRLPEPAHGRASTRAGSKPTRKTTARSEEAAEVPSAAIRQTKKGSKPEKRRRETFSLGKSDVERLESLKDTMRVSGHECRRSTLVRAALALLGRQDAATIQALTEALPPIRRKGAGRHH